MRFWRRFGAAIARFIAAFCRLICRKGQNADQEERRKFEPQRVVLLGSFRASRLIADEEEPILSRRRSVQSLPTVDGDSENGIDMDGTESLDRRQWQQKSFRENESRRRPADLMVRSIPGPFPNEMPVLLGEPSTPQRLAHFFSRPFRNPLKRTKSVSKLDRKRHPIDCADLHSSSEQLGAPELLNTPQSLYGDLRPFRTLQSSRSHESLLGHIGVAQTQDLRRDLRIHPVHPSVLNVENCFQFADSFYACESPQERTRWLENMRRTINPNMDGSRRTEKSLQIWILEVKGVPNKRRYFCELLLDRTLYARTSTKTHNDLCFWGDFFDLKSLPTVETICINLYRETDLKKKKDSSTLIGFIRLDIGQFLGRQPIEKWYTVNTRPDTKSKNADQMAIRIKARYQNIDVLPLQSYGRLEKFVKLNYLPLCNALETCLGVKTKEDFATCLVRILHRQRVGNEFLCDIIMTEIGQLDNDHLMFRGNSLATKSMEAYIKLVAADYLHKTLGDFVKEQVSKTVSYEVDPMKLGNASNATIEANRKRLTDALADVWGRILHSSVIFPRQLREVFDGLRCRLREQNKSELSDKLVSASIFLRYLCPAILSPSLFGLASEYPSTIALRNLTLIAKSLQTLANFTKFYGKESFMEFLNPFITERSVQMRDFLSEISQYPGPYPDRTASNAEIDSEIDFGKELSSLHLYLEENWSNEMYEKAAAENENMGELRDIIRQIVELKRRQGSVGSVSTTSSLHNSTNPPSDYENNNGRGANSSSSSHSGSRHSSVSQNTLPATNLHTSDDYVVSSAVQCDPNASSYSRNSHVFDSPHSRKRFPYVESSIPHSNRQRVPPPPQRSVEPSRQYNIYDDTVPSVREGYHLYDEVSADKPINSVDSSERQKIPPSHLAVIDPIDDESTDSGDNAETVRIAPIRKIKTMPSVDVSQRRPIVPSSGYQSQNQSSYSSSSSSPIDAHIRDHIVSASHAPVSVAYPFARTPNYPTNGSYSSTSSHGNHYDVDSEGRKISSIPNGYPGSTETSRSNKSDASSGSGNSAALPSLPPEPDALVPELRRQIELLVRENASLKKMLARQADTDLHPRSLSTGAPYVQLLRDL